MARITRSSPSGPATGAGTQPFFVWEANPATPGQFLIPGANAVASSANPAVAGIVAPKDGVLGLGTLRDMQNTSSLSASVTVTKNGVATTVIVGFAAGANVGYDNVHTFSVLQGDVIRALITDSGDAARMLQLTLNYVP